MSRKIVQEFRQSKQSLSSLIKKKKNGLCITSSVTSAMHVMSETPVAIYFYALMHMKARPCQCTNTRIIDTQAGFRMTIAINNNLYLFNNLYLKKVTPITMKYFP